MKITDFITLGIGLIMAIMPMFLITDNKVSTLVFKVFPFIMGLYVICYALVNAGILRVSF